MSDLVLPVATTALLKAFSCERFDDDQELLRADYSLSCESKASKAMHIYCGLMSLVCESSAKFPAPSALTVISSLDPIGIPVLFGLLLFKNRRLVSDMSQTEDRQYIRDQNFEIMAFGFLWDICECCSASTCPLAPANYSSFISPFQIFQIAGGEFRPERDGSH